MISDNQKVILIYLQSHKQITLSKAVELTGHTIHHNKRKWVGVRLTTMIKSNLLKRVKPGVFALPDGRDIENQGQLFK